MWELTSEGSRIVDDLARRHALSREAVVTLLEAIAKGHGTQAQFSHPELGGMGQWSQGGMIMIGDLFNQGLKHKVETLCNEIAVLVRQQATFNPPAVSQFQSQGHMHGGVSLFVPAASSTWWPAELGTPAAIGDQNDLRYAYFPGKRRLAIRQGGRVSLYDTGDHAIAGFSQQQSGDKSLTFTSQFGIVRVADLPQVTANVMPSTAPREAAPAQAPIPPQASASAPAAHMAQPSEDILSLIERLADLRQKNILTEEEFAAKKAELLGRL
jgi:Short C-terminal domain